MANEQEKTKYRYIARMKYSPDAIKRLCNVRRNTFEFGKKAVTALLSLVVIAMGLIMSATYPTAILLMVLGCFMLTGLNANARGLADQIIKSYEGKEYPHLQYFFSETGVTTNEMPEECPYSKIVALIEDKEYLYLFQNKLAAFMIDKETVKGNIDNFKKFICGKTGNEFCEPFSLLKFNMKSYRKFREFSSAAKQLKGDGYEGERLGEKKWFR